MKRVLYVTNLPAPYKIDYFECMSRSLELTVIYERKLASNRDQKWKNDVERSFSEIYLDGFELGNESSLSVGVLNYLNKKYDLIILNGYSSPTMIIAIEFMRIRGIKFVISCDGMLPAHESRLKYYYKKHLIQSAAYYLSSGDITSRCLVDYGVNVEHIFRYPFSSVKNNEVLNTNVNKEEYKKKLGFLSEKIILFVGQFIHRKGIDLLMQAYDNIRNQCDTSIELVLIGGEAEQVNSQIHEGITIIPFKTKKELNDYYLAADVFVLPTREDIWGLVVNEAFAFGLPVVTSDHCGAGTEMIKQGINGFIFQSEDVQELEIALKKALALKCFDQSIQTAKNYTIERMAERTIDMIRAILS